MNAASLSAREQIAQRLGHRALHFWLATSFIGGSALILVDSHNASNFGLALFFISFVNLVAYFKLPRLCLFLTPLSMSGLLMLASPWLGPEVLPAALTVTVGVIALLLGPLPGVVLALIMTALCLSRSPLSTSQTPLPTAVALTTMWFTLGLLLIAVSTPRETVDWLATTYERMRQMLEAARDQRLQLKQAREDLVRANQELARVSERLRSMRELAEQARKAKEEFVANVSHELRTPLNMIIGFSEMITEAPYVYGPDIPARLLADIDVIRTNSQHLASLVNDVLDLSQTDASRMALSKEWVNPRHIVDSAVAAVAPLFASKNLPLQTLLPEDLPDLYCDRTRIRQVVLNLLSNAGRFTERGHVRVAVERRDQDLIFSVSDTGPGISPEDQKRIFQPFEQLDGVIRQRYGGSGLGLTISKRFAELHGGEMWLQSELGVGTSFFVRLPLTERDTAGDESLALRRWFRPDDYYEPRSRSSQGPLPRLVPRLVLVDGGSSLRQLFGEHPQEMEVVATTDLQTGIREASRLPAQALVINDAHTIEDVTDAEWLGNLPHDTPVIRCSWPDQEYASKRLGLVRYLVKPIKRDALLAALDALDHPVRTVLLADDDPDAILLFDRMLSSANKGYRVIRAMTGRRALELSRQHRPDVILLDLIMPDMDGYQVLKEKSLDPTIHDIPTIAISAQDPIHGPATCDLLVSKGGGLAAQDVLRSVLALSEVLAPPDQIDRGRQETRRG